MRHIKSSDADLENSAKEYILGRIHICSVIRMVRQPHTPAEAYHTTRGAFMFPLSGQCTVSFDERIFPARAGMIIHGCPGKRLRFEVSGEAPFVYVNLYYETTKQFLFAQMLKSPLTVRFLLERLLEISGRKAPCDPAPENYLLSQLFEQIYGEYITPEVRNERELVREAAGYIREHSAMDLSLAFLAEIFGKTPNQFGYLFHTYYGIRPIHYLIACRMDTAARELVQSDKPIHKIAEQVGYADPLFFSRLFKKHRGCSPRCYRSLYKGDKRFSNQDKAFW